MRARTFAIEASAWRMCVAGLIMLGLVAVPALAGKAISNVGVENHADRVVISVRGDSPLTMSVLSSAKGSYVGFQFPGALWAKGNRVSVRAGGVRNVRYGNFSAHPPRTRIVANTNRFLSYSTQWARDRKSVEISVWKHGAKTVFRPPPAVVSEATRVVMKVAGSLQVASASMVAAPLLPQIAQVAAVAVNASPRIRSDAGTTRMARIVPAAAEPPADSADSTAGASSGKKLSLNFLGADINDVLKALSVQSGENIVASKDVTGNVTVSLADVDIEEALDYVAKLSGYGYAKDKDTYLVGSKDSLRNLIGGAAESKTEVIALTYSDPDSMLALLKARFPNLNTTSSSAPGASPAADAKGPASTSKPGGLIVLSGSEELVSDAARLVAQVENSLQTRAAEEQVQVYEVRYVNAQELQVTLTALVPEVKIDLAPSDGFDLKAPDPAKLSSANEGAESGVKIAKEELKKDVAETYKKIGRVQRLVLSGTEAAVSRAIALAGQLDKKPSQVKLEAKITQIDETGEKKLGLSWEWSSFSFLENTSANGSAAGAWARQPFDFAATLDALIKNGNGKLLASPTLLCIENQPASFFVGDVIHYIVSIDKTTTGTIVVTDKDSVGVELRVNADVNPDGYITLNLHPEVSTFKLPEDKNANIALPIISRRYTDHVVRLKDGDTIVIGGLIRDEEIDEMSKVPILGDLPLLGHLFRHRAKTKQHSEVVMFIKASIVND